MRVLLQYFDQASQSDNKLQALLQTIQDNLQRVISFLVQRRCLIQESDAAEDQTRVALYTKSKGIIGEFW